MTKRIITLDWLRGFSIFLMIFFHVFINSSKLLTQDPFSTPFLATIFVLLFIFGHFRGFFVLISGSVNVYSMNRSIKSGKELSGVVSQQVGGGIFLVIFGHLKDTFINQWGILRDWYLAGGFNATNFDWAGTWATKWQLGIISEAIQNIGWCVILTSIIYGILIKIFDKGASGEVQNKTPGEAQNNAPGEAPDNTAKYNAIVNKMAWSFGILAISVIYLSPIVQSAVSGLLNYDITANSDVWNVNVSGATYLLLYFAYDLAGAEAPIFPMLSYSLIGAVIGIYLTRDDLDRSFLRKSYLIGFLLLLGGMADFVLRMMFEQGFSFNPLFHVHPTWYVMMAIGIQVMLVAFAFRLGEFNSKLEPDRLVSRTRYIRRWGMFSLTVYALQILEYIPRAIIATLFPQSNLAQWSECEGIWLILFMFSNWLMWEVIIRLWERMKMKGTFEWLLIKLAKRKKKISPEDPLNIKGTLYEVEPVLWTKARVL